MINKFLSLLILLLLPLNLSAQNISAHQWNNRLLLVLTTDTLNKDYQTQMQELLSNEAGLLERKIIVYTITPDAFRTGLQKTGEWKKSSSFYLNYKRENDEFEIQLIGLDGMLKEIQSEVLTCKKLFSWIDQMPMRRRELRKKEIF